MKKRLMAALLAALLICALAGMALAEEAPDAPEATLETEVSIGFEGAVYFVEMESGGMDIDFGSHVIPKRVTDTWIRASDGSHTLRVCDRRSAPGRWSVSGIVTAFTNGTDSFFPQLCFFDSTVTPGLTRTFAGTAPNQFVYVATTTYQTMAAIGSLAPGEYDLTTTAENTRLALNIEEAKKVKPLAYSATITWTLTLTP